MSSSTMRGVLLKGLLLEKTAKGRSVCVGDQVLRLGGLRGVLGERRGPLPPHWRPRQQQQKLLLLLLAVWLGQSIAVLVNIWGEVEGQMGTLNWKLYTDQRFHSLMMAYAFIVEIEMTML